MKKYVKTSYEGCDYIIPEKPYKVLGVANSHLLWINTEEDKPALIFAPGKGLCCHLNEVGNWEWVEPEAKLKVVK